MTSQSSRWVVGQVSGDCRRPHCYPTTCCAPHPQIGSPRASFPPSCQQLPPCAAALLQAASAFLFAFDPTDLRLGDIIQDDRCGLRCHRHSSMRASLFAPSARPLHRVTAVGRHTRSCPCMRVCLVSPRPRRWFCLAAVSSPRPGVEQIVGFVAAAVGRVGEFTQEAPFLTQTLLASQAGSSSNAHPPAEAGTLAAVGVTAAPEHLDTAAAGGSDDSSDGSSSRTAAAAATAADALAVEVVLLGVVSGYRRQGVASRLLQQVKRHARSTG